MAHIPGLLYETLEQFGFFDARDTLHNVCQAPTKTDFIIIHVLGPLHGTNLTCVLGKNHMCQKAY